jgi:hypothetical protein
MCLNVGVGNSQYTLSEAWANKLNSKISDKVLEKSEVEDLKKGASDDEKAYLQTLIGDSNDGDQIETRELKNSSTEPKSITFTLYKYDEKDEIPGKTNGELVSNIGQGDHLKQTKKDDDRCGAAAIVNSVILADGKEGFKNLAEKLGLKDNTALTYENVHLVQEKLMDQAKAGKEGMGVSFGNDGKVNGGTFVAGVKAAGKEVVGLERADGSRQDAADKFYTANPKGVVMVNCSRGPGGDDVKFSAGNGPKGSQDHWVAMTKEAGPPPKYFIADSYAQSATGKNRRELSDSEVEEIMSSSRPNFGVK